MALARRFEELEIWQEARELHRVIWGEFKECREFAFRDQIRRAALSVMNNIAEGFERRTPQRLCPLSGSGERIVWGSPLDELCQ